VVEVIKLFPHGAVDAWSESADAFKVNGQHLKPYFVGQPINKLVVHTLTDPKPHKSEG